MVVALDSLYLTGVDVFVLLVSGSECWPYQTAKLVLQQLGGSAQWSLRGQRLKRLDAMGRRVSGAHWITSHADIWAERAKYKYTRPGICSQRPHTHDYLPVFHKKHPHAPCNLHTLHIFWLTCSHFIQSYQTAQHLREVQSQQQVTGLKWLWVREGEHEHESQRVICKYISLLKIIANSRAAGLCHHLATLPALSSQSITLVIFDRSSGWNTQAQQMHISTATTNRHYLQRSTILAESCITKDTSSLVYFMKSKSIKP